MAAGLGKAAFGGGSVVGDGGGHRRTVEVRGTGARARRRGGDSHANCEPDGVGRKKRAPNSWALERPWLYSHDDL